MRVGIQFSSFLFKLQPVLALILCHDSFCTQETLLLSQKIKHPHAGNVCGVCRVTFLHQISDQANSLVAGHQNIRKNQGGGCDVSHPHCLGSDRQEVQDPITEGAAQPEVPELDNEIGGHNCVES